MSAKHLSRVQIQNALSKAFIEQLSALGVGAGNERTLRRTLRAIAEIFFGVAEAGDTPPTVAIHELTVVVRRRLPRLKSGPPVWPQKPGSA